MLPLLLSLYALLPTASSQNASCIPFPSPGYTRLETLLFEGITQGGFTLANKVEKCIGIRTVSPIAAEWMRVAFHDIATHNSQTGEGGLDYSIAFELDRPENELAQNVGPGQTASLEEYRTASNPYYSMSDLIAMAVVFSTVSCSGPYLSYRSGRIDSYVAGPSGVPQAQESLETHTNRFATMGFTQEEMISLTACGHSMGGVRNVDFPNIDNTTGGILMFDRTRATMDPAVLTEYLSGTSINPLITDANNTLNSDARVFSADGNVTVTRMAESAYAFNSICRPLLERFIDTVPSTVTLSDIYEPTQHKVDPVLWAIDDGQLTMNVGFRVLDATPAQVTMHWTSPGQSAQQASSTTAASPSTITGVVMAAANHSAYRYNFAAKVPDGVESFWFEYDGTKVDNGGCGGFGYTDEGREWKFVWEQGKSVSDAGGKLIVAAVHDSISPTNVSVDLWAHSNLKIPTTTTLPLTLNSTIAKEGGYTFYSTYVPSNVSFNAFTVRASVNGVQWSAESVDSLLIYGGSRGTTSNSSTVIPYVPPSSGGDGSGAGRVDGRWIAGSMVFLGVLGGATLLL
ncbi:heme peroxidase [Atractiella rhizophila]|nr:heme peroxidase [Atractiella rhizophila]